LPAGIALALGGAATYQSFANRSVLGRWSPAYTATLIVLTTVLLLVIAWLVRRARNSTRPLSNAGRLFDAGVLAWGVASALAALGGAAEAGRLANGVVFGSVVPAAVLLDGVSVACLIAAFVAWVWARRGAPWANGALFVATLLVLLGLGELGVRVRAVLAPRTQGFPTYTSALWSKRYVGVNSRGYRDVEHRPAFSQGCRVAVVGDSYAFGVGIQRLEDRFSERLGRELTAVTGVDWESANLSRSDTHTLQHIALREDLASLHPDLVVLLYVFNDIEYLRAITTRGLLTEAPRSLLHRLHPGRIIFHNSFLVQELLILGRLAAAQGHESEWIAGDPYRDSVLVARHLDDLATFVALREPLDALIKIVPLDVGVVAGGYPLERYARFLHAAAARGLPVVGVQTALDGHALRELIVNRFDQHPNELAYRLVAAAAGRSIGTGADLRARPCLTRKLS
jgi:hypothetical protein